MPPPRSSPPWPRLLLGFTGVLLLTAAHAEAGLLFHVSGDRGTTADFSAGGTPEATFASEVTVIPDGAKGVALSCGDLQRLAWRAPGNIYAQRGTLSFFWRSRYAVGPTEFPIFRVGYAEHSSWDMVWLRLDYNGHGFDAFVTDTNLARTRVSVTLPEFPKPSEWIHLALAWDETRGIRFYVNGRLAAKNETTAVYDAALDQFGPHSRIISPWQVQSDYNFTRGGDIDEIRIYDRMVEDAAVAALAKGENTPVPSKWAGRRALNHAEMLRVFGLDRPDDPATRAEWLHRYGWDRPDDLPPALPGQFTTVRKVEIHDAYDLGRWWWKACDGIRETTWPGVYNRSRLPGRNDYFQLPDWDCYSLSGRRIDFRLPDEPWNHVEIWGSAWGALFRTTSRLIGGSVSQDRTDQIFAIKGTALPRPKNPPVAEKGVMVLSFDTPLSRLPGQQKSVHVLNTPARGGTIAFLNAEPEEPIGEFEVLNVTEGREPVGRTTLAFDVQGIGIGAPDLLAKVALLRKFIDGRYPEDEGLVRIAIPADRYPDNSTSEPLDMLPFCHILIPDTWDNITDGLDGIAIDLPAIKALPGTAAIVPMNIRVKDPLWPLRDMLDFSFSVKPGEAHTLWLDLRDRLLPPGKPLYLTIATAEGRPFSPTTVRLVFKPREAARAEHELDRFTQARDSYAMLVEEHPKSPKYDLWNRFEGDLKDLLRVNPDHVLGRQYAAVALGAPRPPFTQPDPPAGVPLWAFRQVTQLGLVEKFVTWYVDHRQDAFGDFGGGISDDTDLTNMWPGVALMGCAPEKLADSIRRLLDAAYANGMFTRGLPTIQADELHSYEEGINCLGQNLILNHGSPRQLERAMETSRGFAGITGVNAAGHRHIRTSYYNGNKMAVEDPWGWAKSYSYLVAQPGLLLTDYNGNPAAKKTIGLLAHRHADEFGKAALPTSIRFADDREGVATRGNLPWPLLWGAWKFSGRRDYLDPILDGGPAAVNAVNANALDLLGLRDEWRERILSGERGRPVDSRRDGVVNRPRESSYRGSVSAHTTWQLTGDKRILEKLYGDQIEETKLQEYINTEGSLWIDRVGVPYAELQRARLGGIALTRGATYPGHAVSWRFAAPATAESVAVLIPDATATSFKVIACNLETTAVRATMTGWNIEPGIWEIKQGLDTNDDDTADQALETRTAVFERSRSVELTLPPRATTVLTFKLKTPGTPYWSRPDLGIDPEDVSVQGREVRVTVHSLGAVPSPGTTVALRDKSGRVLATAGLAVMPAPVDLMPRTAVVTLKLPGDVAARDCTVEIDPDHRLEEITTLNNAMRVR